MKSRSDHEDRALFREAVRDVKPLGQQRDVMRPRMPRLKRPLRRVEREALFTETVAAGLDAQRAGDIDEHGFRRPGVQDGVLRKLRRGKYRVDAHIDLHGLTAAQATAELQSFLAHSVARGFECVRVVHGKGLRSGERGPVLRQTADGVLSSCTAVKAFVRTPVSDGGGGASYVLLKRR